MHGAFGSTTGARRARRAFTLIELLVVMVLIALMTGGAVAGIGAATNAQLKGATTMVSSAIRSAYARAGATAKPERIVFDFELRRVWIEEGIGRMLAAGGDRTQTGGADAATNAEKAAVDAADKLLKGPRAPKVMFSPVKQLGLDEDASAKSPAPGRELAKNIRFREVHVAHQAAPARAGRAYLYVWPGGLTESAYIQIAKGERPTDADTMTLFVHPLTGRVTLVSGAKTMAIPLTAEEGSEREDRGPM